ncbi:MAG: N-6 DNA methylase, partial [Calditrichota bacterium]
MVISNTTLREYIHSLEQILQTGQATESSYRAVFETFIKSLQEGIEAINEPRHFEGSAPDYKVFKAKGTLHFDVGYIETKDIGASLNEVERSEQLKRYRAGLDNLLLTNYLEFRWFVLGAHRGTIAIARLGEGNAVSLIKGNVENALALINDFLNQEPPPIARASELAERMARPTRIIRDTINAAFEKKAVSAILIGLRDEFKRTLLPHLENHQFADMFAQTLAYGLFAARASQPDLPFSINDAARLIPSTNPFLRSLFHFISGPDLDAEPFVGYVNDLVQLLSQADIPSILTDFGRRKRYEDPVLHFYETFLSKFDPTERERRGVYYTPESVISYIVRSVDELLKAEFGCAKGLADKTKFRYSRRDALGKVIETFDSPRVLILDPACGTGSFLYGIVNHIRNIFIEEQNAGEWRDYVRHDLIPRLFGFELMMA